MAIATDNCVGGGGTFAEAFRMAGYGTKTVGSAITDARAPRLRRHQAIHSEVRIQGRGFARIVRRPFLDFLTPYLKSRSRLHSLFLFPLFSSFVHRLLFYYILLLSCAIDSAFLQAMSPPPSLTRALIITPMTSNRCLRAPFYARCRRSARLTLLCAILHGEGVLGTRMKE